MVVVVVGGDTKFVDSGVPPVGTAYQRTLPVGMVAVIVKGPAPQNWVEVALGD